MAKKPVRKQSVSKRTKARNTRYLPAEREKIKARIVKYFPDKKEDFVKELLELKTKVAQDKVLRKWKSKMEEEIEKQDQEVSEYLEQIDAEYKCIGRPRSKFNWKELEYLCTLRCTLEEIAGFFQISKTTIQEHIKKDYKCSFGEYFERHSQGINVSIRRKQLQVAMSGDVQMLKFLGKNVLGQKDKVDFDGEVTVNSWVDLMNGLDDRKKDIED